MEKYGRQALALVNRAQSCRVHKNLRKKLPRQTRGDKKKTALFSFAFFSHYTHCAVYARYNVVMAASSSAAFRAAARILGGSCLLASGLAAADPQPLPPAQPPPAQALPPQPLALTRLDFARSSMAHHLLHGALAGADMLERYELSLSSDRQRLRGEVCLGKRACGHPAFLHGGAIASVLDDCMGVLFLSSGNGTGFTANLNVNYRRPIPAGTPLLVDCAVLRVEVGKSGARKVHLSARLLGGGGGLALDPLPAAPTVYAEATALFVVKSVPGLESSEALVASIRNALGLR